MAFETPPSHKSKTKPDSPRNAVKPQTQLEYQEAPSSPALSEMGVPHSVAPEEDLFIFRKMGRKLRQQLQSVTESFFSRKDPESDSVFVQPNPLEKHEQATVLTWSAFRVPCYVWDDPNKDGRALPMILALLKVSLATLQPLTGHRSE